LKRWSAVIAFAMLAVAAIAAGEAIAATTPVSTSVTIGNGNGERVTGRVTSPKKACMKGRKITLYMAIGGARRNYGYPGFQAVGTGTTKSNGNWEVKRNSEEAFQEGYYRAFVAAKRVTSGGESLLCMSRWGPSKHV
jgi:hypothetical protein